ncbi:MAG: thioredoxin domain-containing protein [Candidatus Komeilibacteria bacterium]
MQGFHKKSFIQGLVAGILIVAVLGGVYMLGARGNFLTGNGTVKNNNVVNVPTDNTDPNKPQLGTVKAASKDEHITGSVNAKVVLIEYSDYECPYCKNFDTTMQQVVKAYGNKVAWVYRHFPLSFHANAQKEAEASECVASLGGNDAFWSFSKKLYERTTSNGTGFALTALGPLAKEVGVDQNKFQTCLDSGQFTAKVNTDLSEGQAAGITGTPGTIIVVDGKAKSIIPGALPLAQVKALIDAEL